MRAILLFITLCLAVAGIWVEAAATPEGPGLAEDEERLWNRAVQEEELLLQSGRVFTDDALQQYLQEVIQKLRPCHTPGHLTFTARVIKAPQVDSFAYPNGFICIHTGLLARIENEAQLAALLAHEMAHCIKKHYLRAMHGDKKAEGASSPRLFSGKGAQTTMLRSTGASTVGPDYPLNFEGEADRMALELLIRAGYDGAAALQLFELLVEGMKWEQMNHSSGSPTKSDIRRRQEACEELLDSIYGSAAGKSQNTGIYLNRIREVLLVNAKLELEAGNFDHALHQLEKYLKLHPDHAPAHYIRGEVFRQRGNMQDTKRAMACYQEAIALDHGFSPPYQKIALIYYKEGRNDLALKAFETSLRLDPNSPDRAYILSYMSRCKDER